MGDPTVGSGRQLWAYGSPIASPESRTMTINLKTVGGLQWISNPLNESVNGLL